MTEDEFWEWVADDPKGVGVALLTTLEALKVGVDCTRLVYAKGRDLETEVAKWNKDARKVLDAFGTE